MGKNKFLPAFALCLLILVFFQTRVWANDEWIEVRSKNFNLIGNAAEKDIRQVGERLEQFREGLRQVLSQFNFNSPIPTKVIVFKTALDYKPYKPLKSSGETNDFVTGYFQGGKDVNYITLSADGGETARTYHIIFHEYTHFLIRNNLGESKIPPWFNEGLAIYYETFAIENDQTVTLGGLQSNLLSLLKRNNLIPFETFFNIDNYSLHEQGKDGVGLFYAQSWALMHYLKHGNGAARSAQLEEFLKLVMAGETSKEAFTEAFQTDYQTMENELKNYIEKNSFPVSTVSLKNKLNFDLEMQSKPLTGAEAKAYLGDLLLHSDRFAEAGALLEEAIKQNPELGNAQISLGLLKVKQNDFVKAREYLEKAVQTDGANYLVHFVYAYALSREGMSNFGFVIRYDPDDAERMRRSLKKAISLNPGFAESYDLYAFISIVRNEQLDEAVGYLNKALEIAPGNQWYLIHLAELYLRKEDFSKARNIAAQVTRTAGEKELKVYAQNTLGRINSTEAAYDEIKNYKNRPHNNPLDQPLTDEELARLRARQMMESLNEALYKTGPGEKRILGYLTRIDCEPQEMIYTIRVNNNTLKLRSGSFDTVRFVAFSSEMAETQIGCGGMKKDGLAVINYRPFKTANSAKASGEIVSIEFVPANFKFLN